MSFAALTSLIDNSLPDPEGKSFAAILGASPSKGARSPILWNAAFKAQGINAEMLPMDISGERLTALLSTLEANPNFIGGAIAMPHKEAVAKWLNEHLTPEAKAIGAVNCLYRDATGRLRGTNTDGEAARISFEAHFGPLKGRTVLLLGPGGAGKAVAAYFAQAIGSTGRLMIASRRDQEKFIASLNRAEQIQWDKIDTVLAQVDAVVNCTSIGTAEQVAQSPLTSEQLARLPGHAVVFDIIYQPRPTGLLQWAQSRGLQTLDGLAMNLEQAVLAYGYAAPQPMGKEVTRQAMEAAKKKE